MLSDEPVKALEREVHKKSNPLTRACDTEHRGEQPLNIKSGVEVDVVTAELCQQVAENVARFDASRTKEEKG